MAWFIKFMIHTNEIRLLMQWCRVATTHTSYISNCCALIDFDLRSRAYSHILYENIGLSHPRHCLTRALIHISYHLAGWWAHDACGCVLRVIRCDTLNWSAVVHMYDTESHRRKLDSLLEAASSLASLPFNLFIFISFIFFALTMRLSHVNEISAI